MKLIKNVCVGGGGGRGGLADMVSTLKNLTVKLGCSTHLGLLVTKPTIDTQLDLSLQNLWLWKPSTHF